MRVLRHVPGYPYEVGVGILQQKYSSSTDDYEDALSGS